MNISVYANKDRVNALNNNKESQQGIESANYKVGDVVQGIVTKVSDQISIRIKEKSAALSREEMPNASEGDQLQFRVIGKTKEGNAILQYIREDKSSSVKGATLPTTILKDSFYTLHNVTPNDSRGVKLSKNYLSNIHQGMTQKDYDALEEEGFSLEKYELERFDRALERIKKQHEFRDEVQEKSIDNVKEEREKRVDAKIKEISDPVLKNQVSALLESGNLPLTSTNISAVMGAVKMSYEATSLTDDAMNYLLQNQMPLSPMNLYTASFNAKGMDPQGKVNGWEEVQAQAQQIVDTMNQNGIPVELEDAKWLYEYNLDINETNVTGLQAIQYLKENYDVNEVVDTIIKGMSQQDAIHVPLMQNDYVIVNQAMEAISHITDSTITQAITNGVELSIANLKQIQSNHNQNRNRETFVSVQNEETQSTSEIEKELKLVTARRQLEEIRLKLTYESGIKLAAKGIRVFSDSIDKIANELRNLESEYYQKLLDEASLSNTRENLDLVRQTLQTRSYLAQAPNYVLGVRFEERNEVTLVGLAESAKTVTSQQKEAVLGYEPLMTAPRSDLGDSIHKAFANMDEMLEEMGIERNDANRRAVRILSYNQMEINEASIEQMKDFHQKVTSVLDDLKPSTVVELIKQRVNPMDASMDTLREKINEIRSEYGECEEERYSNYLVKIQKKHTLTEEERDSYIGIYRLLRQVEKSDGKAIGYLVNSGREITLNNLLTAVRSTKGPEIDVTVDEAFGMSEMVKPYEKSISDQINQTFQNTSPFQDAKLSYEQQLGSSLYESITPEFLEYAQQAGNLYEMTLEQLVQLRKEFYLQSPEGHETSYNQLREEIQETLSMSDEISFLKQTNVKVNLLNIKAANALRMKGNEIVQKIADVVGEDATAKNLEVFEKSINYQEFRRLYDRNVNSTLAQLRNTFDLPKLKVEDAVAMNGYINHMSLLQDLQKSQYYQVPFEVNGRVVGVGISLCSSEEKKAEVSIRIDTESFGELKADFKLINGVLKGLVVCENQSQIASLERITNHMEVMFGSTIEKFQIHTCSGLQMTENFTMNSTQENRDNVQTETLFQIAKAWITGIKEIDRM